MSDRHPETDVEVLKGSIKNPWMFGILVDRYQEAFLRRAARIAGRDSAEDAVQDTFLKIYKYGPRFMEQEGASFSSWAYRILTNTCYSYASRRSASYGKVLAMDFGDLDVLGAQAPASSDKLSLVHSVLSRMPCNLSRLLSLYFFEEKSYQEIAVAENISLSAVKSGLHRAKKRFKDVAVEMI